MKIPTGNFGNAVPQATSGRADVSNAGAIGAAVKGFADDIGQQTDAVIRARAGEELLDYQIKIKDINESIRQGIDDGTIRADQIEKTYQTAVSKLDKPSFGGLDLAGMEVAQRGIKRYQSDGQATAMGYYRSALKIEAKDQVDSQLDQLGKLTNYPDADIEKINGMSAGLETQGRLAYGGQWGKIRQNWIDKNWFNQAQQRLMSARDNGAALSSINAELTDEKGFYIDKLDPDKRNALLNQTMGYQARLEAKAAAAEAKREAQAARAINSLAPLVYSGNIPSAELQASVLAATKGTESESEAKELLNLQPEIQSVINKGPLESANYVGQLRAELNKKGGNIADYRRLDMLDRVVTANTKLFENDPLTFVQNRTGEEIAPLNLNNLDLLSSQIADRAVTLSALQENVGVTVPRKLLRPQEVEQLRDIFDNAPASQKVQILDAIRQGAASDTKAYTTTLQQVSKENSSAAVAGMIMDKSGSVLAESNTFSPDINVNPTTAATLILQGSSARKGSKEARGIPMPKDSDLRPEFADTVKDAFAGDTTGAETAYQVAQDYYAGVMAKKGNVSGEIDNNVWKQAINIATGGVHDYNGEGHILLPWGMSATQFDSEVNTAWKSQVVDAGIKAPPGQYGLQSYGDSQYLVKLGAGYLMDNQGQPVIIKISNNKIRFSGDIPK